MPQQDFEQRLETLREESGRTGQVHGNGAHPVGSPIPIAARRTAAEVGLNSKTAYYNQPLLKQPVWTWQISFYFFFGGLAGMAAVIAAVGGFHGESNLLRTAMWLAFAGAILSPILLIWDLGRPWLFLNMLRVFKPQSPMSMGVYILTVFGTFATPGALLIEADVRGLFPYGTFPAEAVHVLGLICATISGLVGLLLATYTGVLIGATAIPAWFSHHRILPIHFGIVGLGCASATLQLLGFNRASLVALAIIASVIESGILVWLEIRKNGEIDRALHLGISGWMIRVAGVCSGPLTLIGQIIGIWFLPAQIIGAALFLAGGLLSRFGWINVGHHSAKNPTATLAAQK